MIGDVSLEGFQHGGQGRGAHDGGVLAQGVEDFHGLPQGAVGGQTDGVKHLRRVEGVGEDFGIAQTPGNDAGLLGQRGLGGVAALGGGAVGQGGGDAVVAVEPRHLLGDVGHAL